MSMMALVDQLREAEDIGAEAYATMQLAELLQGVCQHQMLANLQRKPPGEWDEIRRRNAEMQTTLQASWRSANLEWQLMKVAAQKLATKLEREVFGGVDS